MRKKLPILLVFLLLGSQLSGCGARYVNRAHDSGSTEVQQGKALPAVGYRLYLENWAPSPSCIAVLPLDAGDADLAKVETVRRGLYAHLSPKGYRLVPMAEVDSWVARQNANESINYALLAENVECPYVLTGEVKVFEKTFFGFFSDVSVGGDFRLMRAADQETLWEASHTASLKDGGLPLSPIGAASGVFDAGKNLSDEQSLRAVDDLSRRIMATLPDASPSIALNLEARKTVWKGDIDVWLSEIPEADREFAIVELLKTEDLSSMQRESAFVRLVSYNSQASYRFLWAEDRLRREDVSGAFTLTSVLVQEQPTDPNHWYLHGRVLGSLGRFDEADDALIQAIARNQGNADYYQALAYISGLRGESSRAYVGYQKVVDIDPTRAYGWYNLGVLEFNSGRYQESFDAFSRAGDLYLERGDTEKVLRIIADLGDLSSVVGEEEVLRKTAMFKSVIEKSNEKIGEKP